MHSQTAALFALVSALPALAAHQIRYPVRHTHVVGEGAFVLQERLLPITTTTTVVDVVTRTHTIWVDPTAIATSHADKSGSATASSGSPTSAISASPAESSSAVESSAAESATASASAFYSGSAESTAPTSSASAPESSLATSSTDSAVVSSPHSASSSPASASRSGTSLSGSASSSPTDSGGVVSSSAPSYPSASASASSEPSAPVSASPSGSASASPLSSGLEFLSTGPSASLSVSIVSKTQSRSKSGSPTASSSASRSQSQGYKESSSADWESASASPTASASSSLESSRSHHWSATHSEASASPSVSGWWDDYSSSAVSATGSASASGHTLAPSASSSDEEWSSSTISASASHSKWHSASASPSASGHLSSASASASASDWSSEDPWYSASESGYDSSTLSASATASGSAWWNSTASASASASASGSHSHSRSRSLAASATGSSDYWPSASATASYGNSSIYASATSTVILSSTSASANASKTSTSTSAKATSTASTMMMGYYPDWASTHLTPEQVDFDRFDVIDFAFAIPTSDAGLVFTQDDSSELLKRLVATAHSSSKLVKLSIGGWTGSTYFSTICASSSLRATFVDTISSAYDSYELDGIDIDWEYPGTSGASGNAVSSDDSANFLTFLTELRAALPSGALITTAAQVWPFADSDGNPMTDVSAFASIIDWALIMNYDVWGSSSTPGPNAPLSDGCGNSTQPLASAYAAVSSWTSAGMPADQLVLGLPAYAYLQDSTATSLIQRRSTFPQPPHRRLDARASVTVENTDGGTTDGQVMFYSLIDQGALTADGSGGYTGAGGFTRHWDSCSSTPWLKSASSGQIVTYDDTESLSLKAQFAKQTGLKGCNVFSIDGDYVDSAWPLTDAVRSGLGL